MPRCILAAILLLALAALTTTAATIRVDSFPVAKLKQKRFFATTGSKPGSPQ